MIVTNHFIIFCQHKIVGTQSNTKDDSSNSFKTMYPFFPFWPLTTNIKHSERKYYLVYCENSTHVLQQLLHSSINIFSLKCFRFSVLMSSNFYITLLPQTLTHLKWRSLKVKWVSTIPVVLTLVLNTSCSVGM